MLSNFLNGNNENPPTIAMSTTSLFRPINIHNTVDPKTSDKKSQPNMSNQMSRIYVSLHNLVNLFERLIQSAKRTLLIILGSKRLSFDIFETIVVEVEAILNSRPLTNVADQPENEEPLTPNHFLIQRPYSSLPPGNFGDQQPASFKNWKHVQQLMNHVWRRLIKEYLPTLLKRRKWTDNNQPPLKLGDVVWVLKDLTPRGIWPLGRVVETSPGRDGEVRVAKVKTAYGSFVRPVAGLARVFSP